MLRVQRVRTGVELFGTEDYHLIDLSSWPLATLIALNKTQNFNSAVNLSTKTATNPYLWRMKIFSPAQVRIGTVLLAFNRAAYDEAEAVATGLGDALYGGFKPEVNDDVEYWWWDGQPYPAQFDLVTSEFGEWLNETESASWYRYSFGTFGGGPVSVTSGAKNYRIRHAGGTTVGALVVRGSGFEYQDWYAHSSVIQDSLLPPDSNGAWLFRPELPSPQMLKLQVGAPT